MASETEPIRDHLLPDTAAAARTGAAADEEHMSPGTLVAHHPDAFANMSFLAANIDYAAPAEGSAVVSDEPKQSLHSIGESVKLFRPSDVNICDRPTRFSGVPWYSRQVEIDTPDYNFWGCFSMSRHVLRRFEDAFRHALIGLLPAIICAFHPVSTTVWAEPAMIMILALVVPNRTVGTTFVEAGAILRAVVLFLIPLYIIVAYNGASHWALWGFSYVVSVILLATLTEGLTTKMAIFFFTIHMTIFFKTQKMAWLFPLEFMASVLMGVVFGLCVPLFPFPRTNYAVAEQKLRALYRGLSIMWDGVTGSAFVGDNTVRLLNISRLQAVRATIQTNIDEIKLNLHLSMHEPITSRINRSRIRGRVELAEHLLNAINAMIQFNIDVSEDHCAFDHAPRTEPFAEQMRPAIDFSGRYIEEFTDVMCDLDTPFTDAARGRMNDLREILRSAYQSARGAALTGTWIRGPNAATDFPWNRIGFFMFNMGNFVATAANYDVGGVFEDEEKSEELSWIAWVALFPCQYGKELIELIARLFRGERGAVLKLAEALKLAFATITAFAFFFATQSVDPAGGATVIAFVKDANPTNNVLASIDFVLGTVLGSVAGFVAASLSRNLVDTVAYMAALAVFFGFIKTGRKYGGMGFIALFMCLTGMAPGAGGADKILLTARIQQNVIAMAWLALTHLVLWPIWPSDQLLEASVSSIEHLRETMNSFGCCFQHKTSELGKAQIEELRKTITKLRTVLPSCVNEPSLRRLDYPSHEARKLINALARIESLMAPAVLALRFTMRFKAEEEAVTPDKQTGCWTVVTKHASLIDEPTMHLDAILRSLQATIDVRNPSDLAGDLLKSHEALTISLSKLADECMHVFLTELGTRPLAQMYRMSAEQTLLQFYAMLGPALKDLILAAVEWNHIQRD